jgi:hypothetical protein
MAQTVTECLSAGTDSVTVITDINTNGSSSSHAVNCANQTAINELVQRNVDHLIAILAYDGSDDTPNVAGAADSKKTTHVAAITTGTEYIAAN